MPSIPSLPSTRSTFRYYPFIQNHPFIHLFNTNHQCILSLPSTRLFIQSTRTARNSVLKAEKMSFWRQFERGVLCSDAVMVLCNIADTCMDKKGRLIQLSDISHHWRVPKYWDMIVSLNLNKYHHCLLSFNRTLW